VEDQGLKQALDLHGFDAAFGGARRDEEKSRAKERIFSFRSAQHRWDPKSQRPELWRPLQRAQAPGRIDPRLSAVELDRARHLAVHLPREHPGRAALPGGDAPVVDRDGTLIMVDDERMPLGRARFRCRRWFAFAPSAAIR
jgi:sulfate adenylyltransferase subunit 2